MTRFHTPGRSRWALLLAAPLLVWSSGACATRSAFAGGSAVAASSVTVHVQNSSFEEVRVYLVRGLTRYPLGHVGAASREALEIREAWLGTQSVEIVAVPTSSRGIPRSTGLVQLYPGDTVQWSIENHQSVYSLRRR